MKGLIVQEWMADSGGSEVVTRRLLEIFSQSDLYVLWNDSPEPIGNRVYESWLAGTPLRKNKVLALPLMLRSWRGIRAGTDYEWVLASSHLFAHHVTVAEQLEIPKLVYVHTPARYIWEPEVDGRGSGAIARLASKPLRLVDRKRSREAAAMAANSEFTRQRILRTWGREACVIYPPVSVEHISSVSDWSSHLSAREAEILQSLPSEFVLGASRFVPYKALDKVVEAGCALGLPVVLAGSGPQEDLLRQRGEDASVPVALVRHPSDALLYALYQKSLAFIFPAIEDFGIMPIEAMAAGTPVIARSIGGAAESVGLAKGGALVTELTPAEWRVAFDEATSLKRTDLPGQAQIFGRKRFESEMRRWVAESI